MTDRSQGPHAEDTKDHGGAPRPGKEVGEPGQRPCATKQAGAQWALPSPKTRWGIPSLSHWSLDRRANASVRHRGPRCPPREALADRPARTGLVGREDRINNQRQRTLRPESRARRRRSIGSRCLVTGQPVRVCGPNGGLCAVVIVTGRRGRSGCRVSAGLGTFLVWPSVRPNRGRSVMCCGMNGSFDATCYAPTHKLGLAARSQGDAGRRHVCPNVVQSGPGPGRPNGP